MALSLLASCRALAEVVDHIASMKRSMKRTLGVDVVDLERQVVVFDEVL